jgi:hypothetical protein
MKKVIKMINRKIKSDREMKMEIKGEKDKRRQIEG